MRRTRENMRRMLILVSVLFLYGCSGDMQKQQAELTEVKEIKEVQTEENLSEAEQSDEEEIWVHVCGEVAAPGVYQLLAGSRLYEAIEMAGGMTERAAGESLNQAEKIEDGQQIYVPSKEEISGAGLNNGQQMAEFSADDGKVNINTASKEQLMTLAGIGETKASAIIRYREEHGEFHNIDELMQVEGIKEGTFNKIKDQIKI
ncbi:MAG: helix-hairpin-helix domain-containing protein [Dorea sp.]|nr:helix-hairpin-helix domain-containing protein [Dorea sp.]